MLKVSTPHVEYLEQPVECETHKLCGEEQQCTGLAHWRIGITGNCYAQCDACILAGIERLPDNREWLTDVLADIAQRQQDARERRRLFFSLMRRPDMRLMRLALRNLKWNNSEEWRDIASLEMLCIPSVHGSWLLATERFMVHCVAPNSSTLTYEDFSTYWNHVEEHGGREDSNPDCKCLDCRWQALQEVTPR